MQAYKQITYVSYLLNDKTKKNYVKENFCILQEAPKVR